MKIIIHRGQHQIGGSIIEIATEYTKIIIDVGINLDENKQAEIPNVEGLFYGQKKYEALFISHYHSDHIGLAEKVVEGITIYMGENSYKILCASNEYRHINTSIEPSFLTNEESIIVGNIKVTPFRCDHSAYDSYMFLIEADEKTVLYTGDFRSNGRRDYQKLLDRIPQVDVLIIEGTNLSREEARENLEETLLEDIAIRELQKHTGPAFILLSAMNIDRLITAYDAAKKTDRILLEDLYTALITDAAGVGIPNPKKYSDIKVFVTDGNPERYDKLITFGKAKISREAISKQDYIMCVRPSMINYLKKLNELQSFADGILFYGMWKGYQEREDIKLFLDFMIDKCVKIHTLHTSGHADSKTIDRLIEDVKPRMILPVHTENEEWFDRYKDSIEIVNNVSSVEI